MGVYEDHVLPRVIDVLLGNKQMGKLRRRALEGLDGTVAEIGFGSGTNVPYYPAGVERVLAVDPSTVGRKLAAKRIAASSVPVEHVGLDGAALPLDDASVDNVLSTWTLCTIPDVDAALAEVRRVLRPGGRLYFLEHGLSDDPRVARRQHRFDRWQQRIAGGCHLDRDHEALIARSGLRVERVARFQIAGPKAMSHMYAGTAVR
ncbi:MAG: Demethylmenaquinone methyltransferase [Acidimicrobiales bacterium]|nr:Demethylmenaquinone methyltransferase [Acidimicrobiales bacterium]